MTTPFSMEPATSAAPGAAPESPDEAAVGALIAELDRLRTEAEQLRARVSELEELADIDPLAPVYNRRAFLRELRRIASFAARHGHRAAVLYLDLDGFKQINDTFGHEAGDAVLTHVAALLLSHVRSSDIVGRMGGDEFAVGLAAGGRAGAELKARRLAALIQAEPLSRDGQVLRVGASIGVYEMQPGECAEAALRRADAAMYAEKRAGRVAGR